MPASNHSNTHATAIGINGDASQLALILDAQLVGDSWKARCPAHDDAEPSLHISQGENCILLRCFAGCSQEKVLDALLSHYNIHRRDLFRGAGQPPHSTNGNGHAHNFYQVDAYDYTDESDQLLYQTVRLRCACGAKSFRQRRPDPNQPGEWINNLKDTRRVLYRLKHVRETIEAGGMVFIVEGERDVGTLEELGLTATCNPMGAGKWRDEYTAQLAGASLTPILPDNDESGREHTQQVARSIHAANILAKVVGLPGLPEKSDVTDWVAAGGTETWLMRLVEETGLWEPTPEPEQTATAASVWDRAVTAGAFLQQPDPEYACLVDDLVFPGVITIIAGPRGLGKSVVTMMICAALGSAGRFRGQPVQQARVLLIDRDNPQRVIKERLRKMGIDLASDHFKILTRDDAPSLLDREAWQKFPADQYDVVIIDSYGSTTEGVSEKEGKETQQALATLKDLAHRGPAVLALDNTTKDAGSYRGRGEKADAVDALYEVRDCTNWTPATGGAWWEHLPEAGDRAWQSRAARRKGQTTVRMSFVPSKFRLGIEPEPFVLEIDFSTDPWTLADVTQQIADAGEAAQNQEREAERQKLEQAANALADFVRTSETPVKKKDALLLLIDEGLSRRQSDNLLTDGYNADVHPAEGKWRLVRHDELQGRPVIVELL